MKKKAAGLLLLCLCLCALAAPASGQTLYGAIGTGNGTSNLFTLNPANGALLSTIGPIGFGITGLAFHPTTGVLYGSTNANSTASPNNLITINTATGAGTVIGPFGGGCRVADLTFTSSGTLYGWCEPGSDDLVTINLTTGAATIVGDSGLNTFGAGLAANASNVLYFAGNASDDELRTINAVTGLPTTVATMNGSGDAINALAFNNSGTLFASICDCASTGSPVNLATINTATGAITVLGPSVTDMDAIAFSGSFAAPVDVPTLDGKFLALMGALLAAAAILVLRNLHR